MRADLAPRAVANLPAPPVAGAQTGAIVRYGGHLWFDDGSVVVQLDRQTQAGYAMTVGSAVAAGDLVNVYDVGGVFNVRKADGSAANQFIADGYVLAAQATPGNAVLVFFDLFNTSVSGLVAGERFLSATTPGASVSAAVAATYSGGQLLQKVGTAVAAASLHFAKGEVIVTA